jgi:hypothetical protein
MQEWLQVLKAADAAARWHVHQRRKGPAEDISIILWKSQNWWLMQRMVRIQIS